MLYCIMVMWYIVFHYHITTHVEMKCKQNIDINAIVRLSPSIVLHVLQQVPVVDKFTCSDNLVL